MAGDVHISAGRRDVVQGALEKALGHPVPPVVLRPVGGGGCINRAARLEVGGATYFIKWNDHPLPGQFAVEAAGLEVLAAAGTELVVPRPIAFSDAPEASFLIMEYLPPGRPRERFDESLGRGLAELHRASAESFGFDRNGVCGATPQPNVWTPSWLAFYRDQRLGHQMRLAQRRGMAPSDLRVLERLLEHLHRWIPDDVPPSLIHGDLWSGNLHVEARGRPALIDPAAYYAHREAELGMMVLFGGFSPRVFAAYREAWPLPDEYEVRVELYSLYHVLNHYHLFGGGYGAQAVAIARRYVG